jgi:hypothetical protein
MHQPSRVIVLSLALLFAHAAAFAQSAPEPKPAWPAYLFSIFVGFGTGPYWVGQNGNLFLIGDLSCVGVAAAGALVAFSSSPSSGTGFSGASAGYLMISAAAIAFSVLRIWELIDVFGAVQKARKAGVVAELEPAVSIDPTSLGIGVSLRL